MNGRAIGAAGRIALVLALAGCAAGEKATVTREPPQRRFGLRELPPAPTTRPYDTTLRTAERPLRAQRSAEEFRMPGQTGARATPVDAVPERTLDVTLNFKGVDAREVYREVFEKVLKVDYVLAADLGGTAKEMSFILEGRVSPEELLRALDSVSEAYGMALVERDGVIHVIAAKDAPKRGGPVRAGWDRAREFLSNSTHVLPLSSATATDVAEGIKPLVSDRGLVFAPRNTNVLVLIDSPSNAERLIELVRELDRPAFASRVFRIYSPSYIEAADLAKGLTEFALQAGARTGDAGAQFTASVLPRSKQVFVTTSVRELVPALDVWFERLDRPMEGDAPVIHLYTAQHVPVSTLEGAISAAFDRLPEDDRPVVTAIGARAAAGASAPSLPPPQTGAADTGRAGSRTGGGAIGGQSLPTLPTAPVDTGPTTLLIRAKPAVYAEVRELIDMLDTPPKQVYLQVVVAEVTISADVQFGIELFTRQEVDDIPWEVRSAANAVTNPVGSAFILGGNAFALVQAAAQDGKVRVLSAPYVIATSGKPTSLNVGSEVPIIVQQVGPGVDAQDPTRINNSIEYRKAGVILTATPRVNDKGEVELTLQQEVSDVVPPAAGALIQSPSFSQRQIQTPVTVRSGDTVVLGGIRRDRETMNTTGIPLLKDIPLLGLLFQGKNATREQTELVILVTPTIVIEPAGLPAYTPEFLAGVVNLDLLDDLLMRTDVKSTEMLLRPN